MATIVKNLLKEFQNEKMSKFKKSLQLGGSKIFCW
jgi:hypothetical protein